MGDLNVMLNMLNPNLLEQNMLKAAVEGYWDTFKAYYDSWVAVNGGNISEDKFAHVFLYGNQKGSLLRRLVDHKYPVAPEMRADRHKIVKHILDKMAEFDISVDVARGATPYTLETEVALAFDPNATVRVYTWAGASNAPEILAHPLVQEEMIKDKIENLVLNNKLNEARALVKKTGISEEKAFNYNLIHSLFAKYNTTADDKKILDNILAELLENQEIAFHILPLFLGAVPAIPVNLATVQAQLPKVAKTAAFRALLAMDSLAKESFATDEQHLVALRLIDEYLVDTPQEKVADLATGLLNTIIQQWDQATFFPGAPVVPVVSAAEKEAIILYLLDKGADIPFTQIMTGMAPSGYYPFAIRYGMTKALTHPTTLEHFKHQSSWFQKEIVDLLRKFNVPGGVPSDADLIVMKALFPLVSKPQANPDLAIPLTPYMTVAQLIGEISTWVGTPHDAISHERFLKGLGFMLNYGLVHDIDTVAPGSHSLPFINVRTGANYDLYQFIKDNDALNRGFMKPTRDAQLLSLYGLTKAIVAEETRTKERIDTIKTREDFQVKMQDGKPVVYNRYAFKGQMNRGPKDIRAQIMSWVDPERELPQKRRAKTADRLETIALDAIEKEKAPKLVARQ